MKESLRKILNVSFVIPELYDNRFRAKLKKATKEEPIAIEDI